MKIGFFELESWEKEVIEKAFPKDTLILSKNKLTIKEADKYKDLDAVSVFIYSKVDEAVIAKLPKLKLITTRSTGFDHIDLQVCKKKNITVCNVPSYGENTVAEHTFALILSLSRKMFDCVERTKHGSFDLTGLRGFDLLDKKLGVVGSGKIGQHVIRIAKGFGMQLLVYDAFPNQQLAKELGFNYVSMDQLLKEAEIITIHIPYNEHTHHLIDKKAFDKMKKGVYIINTSRGGIIDTNALVKALKSKKVAGAGLDVLEQECELLEEKQLVSSNFPQQCNLRTIIEDHFLLTLSNVIVTPHNAFNTNEALRRILQTTLDAISGFKTGKLVNVMVVK